MEWYENGGSRKFMKVGSIKSHIVKWGYKRQLKGQFKDNIEGTIPGQ